MVARIAKASFPGHKIERPDVWRAPFIFASPHSGRDYPKRFLDDTVLDLIDLRRSEDAYVDELMPSPTDIGVPTLSARFPRAFVDVNRHAREIDPQMFTGSPTDGGELKSNRVLAGFGVIPKLAAEGRQIYAKKLSASEGRSRLNWCYAPYHAALNGLIEECKTLFGHAIVIDWHSMPSTSIENGRRLSDIVLGDRYGASCGPSIIAAWEDALKEQGLTVSRNTPYAGGHVTSLYGQPANGIHALQVEINRGLYLNESQVVRRKQRFQALRTLLANAAVAVIGGAAPMQQVAAE